MDLVDAIYKTAHDEVHYFTCEDKNHPGRYIQAVFIGDNRLRFEFGGFPAEMLEDLNLIQDEYPYKEAHCSTREECASLASYILSTLGAKKVVVKTRKW